MGMEAADPMRTPRAQNASFNHAPRYAVIAGQLFRVPYNCGCGVSRSAMLSISAFRAEFGLGVIWLSAVRVGGLFRVATPLAQRQKAPPSHVAVPLPIAALPLRPGVSRLDSLFETAL